MILIIQGELTLSLLILVVSWLSYTMIGIVCTAYTCTTLAILDTCTTVHVHVFYMQSLSIFIFRTCLENHHVAKSFKLTLDHKEHDIFQNLDS